MAGFDMGSLLNNLLGGAKKQAADGSQPGQQGQPQSGAMGGMLSGDMLARLTPMLGSLLAGGGLAKLMSQLKGGGLGDQAKSWVATDQQNQPVSGEQLTRALGPDTISQFANTLGMSNDKAAQTMAQTLPGVVDAMTPDGQVPQNVPAGAQHQAPSESDS